MTLNRRNRPIELQDSPEHRAIPIERVELREEDDNTYTLEGYASTFQEYDMYGGPAAYGWIERIDPGAFEKTLREKPDLHLLVNHAGMPLARTKSGTLQLSADDHGLKVVAQLDKRDPEAQALAVKMERGDMDEMSFAFRVKAQEWRAADGYEEDDQSYRTITEVSLHKGDVSVVNWGANPTTSAGIRSASDALRYLAECDESELVEARSNEDFGKRAMDRLAAGMASAAPLIGTMNVHSADELRKVEPLNVSDLVKFQIRTWLDAEAAWKKSAEGREGVTVANLVDEVQRILGEQLEMLSKILGIDVSEVVGLVGSEGLPGVGEALGEFFRGMFGTDSDAKIPWENLPPELLLPKPAEEPAEEPKEGTSPADLRMLFEVWDER